MTPGPGEDFETEFDSSQNLSNSSTQEQQEETMPALPSEPIDPGRTGVYLHEQIDENSAIWRWKLENFSTLPNRMTSNEFEVGGYRWRFLSFPFGNHNSNCLSVYLEIPDAADIPKPWFRTAHFHIEVINQKDPTKQIGQDAEKRFSHMETDWGFKDLLNNFKLRDPTAGWLVADTVVIQISIKVVKDAVTTYNWASTTDSRKETGFVGLRNQGATCYMNSLLQTLYFIPFFRKAVYHMPTESEEDPSKSIPLALQRVFFKLQYEDSGVETKELTTSFGWTAVDSFTQHDVQELARVLCDNLEEKMKTHPPVAGTIPRLFKGECLNFIKCVNVPYDSKRSESFYDLQLNVKGCKDVYESFDKYVEVEMLDGPNQYQAEGHGLQDAKKGVIFEKLPSVLMLHLKRFEYDYARDELAKVNDRYEFPIELDLDKYVAEDAPRDRSNTYILLSVLVHSGGVHGGHYYAYIRSKGHWYKFNDDRVSRADEKEAVDDNFGGEAPVGFPFRQKKSYQRFSNAYMLVYVSKDEADTILEEVADEDVPSHLKRRFQEEKELEEKRKQEKAESFKFLSIRVASDATLRAFKGNDLIDPKAAPLIKGRKAGTLGELKAQIEEAHGIPASRQRLWLFFGRQNKTFRPGTLLPLDDTTPLEKVFPTSTNVYAKETPEHTLYVEAVPEGTELRALVKDKDLILFLKHYDPMTQTMEYKGSVAVDVGDKIENIRPHLVALAGLPADTPISAFEEVRPDSVTSIAEEKTFEECGLVMGDIVVYQKAFSEAESASLELPTAPQFYKHLLDKVVVSFYPLEGNSGWGKERTPPTCELPLLRSNTYEFVARHLAEALQPPADPNRIRFTGTWPYNQDMAKTTPFKISEVKTLQDMLTSHGNPSCNLFYEVLDVDVAELEVKKVVELSFFNSKNEETKIKELVPKTWKLGDLLEYLKPKLPLTGRGNLKLSEVVSSKVWKVYTSDAAIDNMVAYSSSYYRLEEISQEEEEMDTQTDRVVQVLHFAKDTYAIRAFGHPFFMVIRKDDTFADLKKRVAERFGIAEAEISKWKPAVVQYSKAEYSNDEDNVQEALKKLENSYYKAEAFLGFEHKDTTPKQASTWSRFSDKPIKILN